MLAEPSAECREIPSRNLWSVLPWLLNISVKLARLPVHLEREWTSKINRHTTSLLLNAFQCCRLCCKERDLDLLLPWYNSGWVSARPLSSRQCIPPIDDQLARVWADFFPFYCWRCSRVAVAFGITLAHTPECKYPVCSPNKASFFPPLLCSLIHSPGMLYSTKHSCEPAGLLSSLRACWEQPATAGKLLLSDVILGRSYATILMPDIVLAPVVCYNVYGSLIFFPQRIWNLIHVCLSVSWFFLLESSEISASGICGRLMSFLLYAPAGLGNFLCFTNSSCFVSI